MNPDDLLPTVTAIVGYDLYPYYLVTKGKLTKQAGSTPWVLEFTLLIR